MDLLNLNAQWFSAWLLTVGRVAGLLATLPLFSERGVPWPTKAGISIFAGFLLLPTARVAGDLPTDSLLAFGLAFVHEGAMGALLGYLARLLMGAFQFAVQAIDFQMGLSFAQLLNPGTDSTMSVLANFINTLILFLFLELDGHHVLFRALGHSFTALPLGALPALHRLAEPLMALFAGFVILALQFALPTVVLLLLIDCAMGLIGRMVPQLNVFIAALPIKILCGLAALSLSLPVLVPLMGRLLETVAGGAEAALRLAGS